MRNKKEYILASAIWYKELPTDIHNPINCDCGLVLVGRRHHNIISNLKLICGLRTVSCGADSVGEYVQGFITNENRFVDRVEGAKIAYNAKQIKKRISSLFSEDLY